MKFLKSIVVYLLALSSFFISLKSALAHGTHTCSHDKDDDIQKTQRKLQEYLLENPYQPTADDEVRRLQSTTIQPIRVTANLDGLSASGAITAVQTQYLTAIANTVVNIVQHFIKVQPNAANNIFDPNQSPDGTCISAVPTASDKTRGIANSDLHLYFIYVSDTTATFLANAGSCNFQQTNTYVRPNFGRVLFNIARMGQAYTSFDKFETDVMVTLHEVIHVLGFSYGIMPSWYNRATKKIYGSSFYTTYINNLTLRSISTNLLSTPNVLATAREYYGCSTATGMQLENQGKSGSMNSHWERTVIRSEVMTASSLTEGLNLTVFTVALLKDTGFWDDVNENLTDPVYWGKGKGCDFFLNACTSTTQYEEFSSNNASACSFWNDAQGIGWNSDQFGDGCYVVAPMGNLVCDDASVATIVTSPASQNSDLLNTFSYNSKCFVSNILNPSRKYNYPGQLRCLQSQCSADYSTITITIPQLSNTQVTCTSANVGTSINVTSSGSTIGQVTCPTNYQKFCDRQLCVNYCSYNGICFKGQCLCNPGFAGIDCSVTCATVVDSTGACVSSCPSGTYAALNNVCGSTCPNGTYASNGVCQQCDFSCSTCNGPLSSNCTACQYLTYLNGNTCTTTCPTGTYANATTKVCTTCPTGCTNCTSGTVCGACNSGYLMSGTICASTSCTSPCATCTSPTTLCLSCLQTSGALFLSGTTCVSSCPSGTYANSSNMTCSACSTGCTTCTSASSCTICNTSSGYRLQGSSCTLCQSPCATCSSSNYSSCNSCESNQYFLNNKCYATCPSGYYNGASYQCSPCMVGCLQCINASSCTTCNTSGGYQAFTLNGQQMCITSSTCYTPCSTCSGSYQPTTCASCSYNLYLQGSTCKSTCDSGYFQNTSSQTCIQCSSSCTTCSNTATNCTSCPSPYFVSNGQCVTSCPTGSKASSGICTILTSTNGIMMTLSLFVISLLFSLL